MARIRSGPEAPTRTPSTTTASPVEGRCELVRPQQRGQPVGCHRTADHPLLGVHDLDHLAPDTGTGLGSRFSLTIAATS